MRNSSGVLTASRAVSEYYEQVAEVSGDPQAAAIVKVLPEARDEFGAGVGGAGRVRRRVEDQPFGLGRDHLVELGGGHLEAGLERGRHGDGGAAGILDGKLER